MEDNKQNIDNQEEEYEEYHFNFIDYLLSDKGDQKVNRVIDIINDIKKSTLDKNSEINSKKMAFLHRERIILIIVFVITVICASMLIYLDKFSTTAALFFGTLAGYFFGRSNK